MWRKKRMNIFMIPVLQRFSANFQDTECPNGDGCEQNIHNFSLFMAKMLPCIYALQSFCTLCSNINGAIEYENRTFG